MRRKAAVPILFLFLFILTIPVQSLEFAFRLTPDALIPLAEDGELFSIGGGGQFSADVELFDMFAPSLEGGLAIIPATNTGNNLLLSNIGLGAGVFFYPIPRLKLRAGAGGGVYSATYDEDKLSNYYIKAGVAAGYRFSPGFSLTAGLDYVNYLGQPESLYSGLAAGITVDINLGLLAGRSTSVRVDAVQESPVFPIVYSSYEKTPIGTLSITNSEQAEIRNVEVSFIAGNYASKAAFCSSFSVIQKGKTVTAPLFAAFNEQVLTLTENSKIQGEVLVTYSLLNAKREFKIAQTIQLNDRNTASWADEQVLGAFVSPNDPAVLEHSKFVAGLVRGKIREEIDKNLQYGLGLFEGLRISGIAYSPDPTTPYAKYHSERSKADYLQYPHQTLAYKGGDCDDLAILYATDLQSVGIPAAFILFEEDVFVAFPLVMAEADARAGFVDPESFIYRGGQAWVPVKVSLLREGFMRAWQVGITEWKEAVAAGETPTFFTVNDAWKNFPPVGIPAVEAKLPKPTEDQVNLAFESSLNRFIAREAGPKIEALLAEMGQDGGTPKQHNNLGVLYARYGMLNEAKSEFKKAADADFVPALTNLGNIAFLEKKYEDSIAFFERVLKIQPANKAALIGLAKAKYELDEYSESDSLVSKVRRIDPALADRYSYLSYTMTSTPTLTGRASLATERGGMEWSEDTE